MPVTISDCSNNFRALPVSRKADTANDNQRCSQASRCRSTAMALTLRDWLHVEDHCAAIACVLEHGRAGETYNIGGGSEMTNIDLVNHLCAAIERKMSADPTLARRFSQIAPAARGTPSASLIGFVKDRPGHDRATQSRPRSLPASSAFARARRLRTALLGRSTGISPTRRGGAQDSGRRV